MSIRTLPSAPTLRRGDVTSVAPQTALDGWARNIAPRNEGSDDATISILDVIGIDWWTGEGVTAKRIAAALRAIGDQDVTVNINSPGGDFFEGLAIYNLLREHPAQVTVNIIGLAASAASSIAMAGDRINIARAGFVMVHNVQWIAAGDRHALRGAADIMDTFDEVLADIYAARSGQPVGDIVALLDGTGDGTWLSGRRAIELGLADGVLGDDAMHETNDTPEDRANNAIRRIGNALAKAGLTRTEQRREMAALKQAMQNAGPVGTQDAAAKGLSALIQTAKSL